MISYLLTYLLAVAISAVIAICWIFTLQCGIVEGQRQRFYPDWSSAHDHGYDVAQNPNSVDDSFGWSWGASSHNNRPQQNGNNNNNGDWSFGNNDDGNNFNGGAGGGPDRFPGGNFNNNGFVNPGSASQQQNQRVPVTSTPTPVTTSAPVASAAPPGK